MEERKKEGWRGIFKQFLTIAGAQTPKRLLDYLQMVVTYLMIGRWMSEHDFRFNRRVHDRSAVFDEVADRVRHKRVLYLEFGVYHGASMRYWSRELKHPDSRLQGFDSFEGLPEDLCAGGGSLIKGAYSTQGEAPVINDHRVQFFKGWFDHVLPGHSIPEHETLVINMDADLYSSTIYVLRHLRPWIRPGAFIYFDEMGFLDHEPRAFAEFVKESGLKFRPICATKGLNQVFFECIAESD